MLLLLDLCFHCFSKTSVQKEAAHGFGEVMHVVNVQFEAHFVIVVEPLHFLAGDQFASLSIFDNLVEWGSINGDHRLIEPESFKHG